MQVSRQCVELQQAGWLQPDGPDDPGSIIKMQNPKEPHIKMPVIVAGMVYAGRLIGRMLGGGQIAGG